MGNFENVLKCDEPKKIECFCNFSCLQIATGNNFAIVLVRQRGIEDSKKNDSNFMERTKQIGKEVLKTQVWSFGSINKSDSSRKDNAVSISLVDMGVFKISCGSNHAAALTYDGRLFLWGVNSHQQISLDSSVPDFLTPIEFKSEVNGKTSKNVLAVACGATNTIILLNDLTFRVLGKNGSDQNEEFASDLKYEHDAGNIEDNEAIKSVPYVIAHSNALLVNRKNIPMFLLTFLTDEQRNARILINVHTKYIKALQTMDDDSWQLAKNYENILYIAIANLRMTHELLLSDCEQKLENVIVNNYFNDVMKEFYHYLRHLCDIRSFYSLAHYEKRMDAKLVKIVLEKPFASLEIYDKLFDLIYDLHLYNNPNALTPNQEIEEMQRLTVERKKIIEDFRKIVIPQRNKEANDTFSFWQSLADAHIKSELHHKERRFVMDSNQTQLKLHERTNLFGSNRFILFNDYLVCVLARTEFIPIHLVWLQAFSTPSPNKFSFRIITPESVIKVYALTPQDKNDWQKNIRDCTRNALRISPTVVNQALPVSRYGSYKFSDRNAKYPSYEVEGKWFEGRFNELCHIKIPAVNRQFKCRVSIAGEVTGNGMIEDSQFSYHGEIVQGKLQGFGTWKSKFKAIHYQGFFKNDKFHGHGVMSNDENVFFGEFVNGTKNGYGIEDDAVSGNKYIGMWQDGKRHGAGILITMDGSYFEGIFINNNLSGDGLAIFPNGSYYIGELSVDGASGIGTLHLPDAEIVEEIMELDDSNMKMKGNILKGLLAGSWDKIGIINGSLLMNEIFLKTPK
jgi:amyotrophic lateral sclerosis 2 protein